MAERRPGDQPGVVSQRRWQIRLQENWYRDVWLALISVVVVIALLSANSAISEIQRSRLAACWVQDSRHDRTLQTLDTELKRLEHAATPGRRAQLEASRASTVALINQLAPHQNCVALIRRVHRVRPAR